MCFDSCKEDIIEGYQCECGGSITKERDGTNWQCDTCDFIRVVSSNKEKESES